MDLRKTETRLDIVLTAADGWLPAEQLAEMRALVAACEPGIALENFCTQLEEYDVVVPADIARELVDIARSMGITLSPWIGPRT